MRHVSAWLKLRCGFVGYDHLPNVAYLPFTPAILILHTGGYLILPPKLAMPVECFTYGHSANVVALIVDAYFNA
jgi:hypothetical protein